MFSAREVKAQWWAQPSSYLVADSPGSVLDSSAWYRTPTWKAASRRDEGGLVRTGHHARSVVLCEGQGGPDGLSAALGFKKKIAMIGHGDTFQTEAQLSRRRGAGAGRR